MPRFVKSCAARWAVCGLVLLLLASLLAVVASGNGIIPLDRALAEAARWPAAPVLDRLAWLASRAGDTVPEILVALLIVAALAYRGRVDLALLVATAAALRATGPLLKDWVASPRPPAAALNLLEQADGPGYPSGHALGAALLYGAIAVIAPEAVSNRAWSRAIQVVAIVMIVLVAWSRVRLGVHWPSDVAGGVLFGTGLVCVLNAIWLAWRRRLERE